MKLSFLSKSEFFKSNRLKDFFFFHCYIAYLKSQWQICYLTAPTIWLTRCMISHCFFYQIHHEMWISPWYLSHCNCHTLLVLDSIRKVCENVCYHLVLELHIPSGLISLILWQFSLFIEFNCLLMHSDLWHLSSTSMLFLALKTFVNESLSNIQIWF